MELDRDFSENMAKLQKRRYKTSNNNSRQKCFVNATEMDKNYFTEARFFAIKCSVYFAHAKCYAVSVYDIIISYIKEVMYYYIGL